MNNVDTRSPFFPRSKTAQNNSASRASQAQRLGRNSYDRAQEIETKTADHARVSIPEKIRDFSRIKKAVDAAPEIDNTDKIARLKAQIQGGTYQMDYDAIADKMLASEY